MTLLTEKAPPDPKIEKWIKDNKKRFIDEYGKEKGIEILYAKAWKMHKENDEMNEAVLTLQQRRKRAQTLKRIKTKIVAARKRASRKIATKDKLMGRAKKLARQMLRKRLAGKMGEDYKNLSVSQKMTIDKKLEGKSALIDKLARRLFPKVRQKELDRFKKRNSVKESTEIMTDMSIVQWESFKDYIPEDKQSKTVVSLKMVEQPDGGFYWKDVKEILSDVGVSAIDLAEIKASCEK